MPRPSYNCPSDTDGDGDCPRCFRFGGCTFGREMFPDYRMDMENAVDRTIDRVGCVGVTTRAARKEIDAILLGLQQIGEDQE